MYQIATDNKNYKLILFGKDLLYLAYLDDAEIDLQKIKEINDKGLNLVGNKPFYSIVNLQNVFASMSNEAKDFVANNEVLNNLKIVEVLYVNNLPMKILIKGYLTFNKPKTITKVYKKMSDLIHYLKEYNIDHRNIEELHNYLKSKVNI